MLIFGTSAIADELVVTAAIKQVGKATVLFEQSVLRGDNCLCAGEVKVACVSRANRKPVAMPDALFSQINN